MHRIILWGLVTSLALLSQEVSTASANFVVVLSRGPKWIAGRTVSEQPLREHGLYLNRLMEGGKLVLAGPFVDDSGGLILLRAANAAEAQKIADEDPAIQSQIMQSVVRPFRVAFDATTGLSPFKKKAP